VDYETEEKKFALKKGSIRIITQLKSVSPALVSLTDSLMSNNLETSTKVSMFQSLSLAYASFIHALCFELMIANEIRIFPLLWIHALWKENFFNLKSFV
jgi:hypothetical protein